MLIQLSTAERMAYNGAALDGEPGQINQMNLVDVSQFQYNLELVFNTWVRIGYCPGCITESNNFTTQFSNLLASGFYTKVDAEHEYSEDIRYATSDVWVGILFTCTITLFLVGLASIIIESRLVAPDTLGYVSTTVRNSRYLTLPKSTTGAMSGSERARRLGTVEVMMQDVKSQAEVGKIALGLKTDSAERLKAGRLYR